ncbi:omega-hydroxypalmitate O-feruloyl transferase-like [Eucalyptus grandis]|uniref:omega-hydroxypalmitate O-feruloyl transferase-like n=1 Tax=Eucalyptus grandis TaxID=71139 RepID=UPI00192EFF9D|nr:omega-hydroxypalmitate O-feruloyl transferase-like [Eucalyptus grandis]
MTKRVRRLAMVALDTAPSTPLLVTAEGGGKVGLNVTGDGGESDGMGTAILRGTFESFEDESKNARETFGGLYALSNLDQTFPFVIETVFAFNGKGRGRCSAAIETIRESLAKALVEFYPFAGRLVMGSDGRMVVRCTGEGVPFVEATSEDDIAVLVTTFKCGGIVVGIVMNHILVDGKALMDFIACWTDLARAKPPSLLPFLDRSVLCPRRPPHIDFPHHEYAPRDRQPGHVVDPQTKPLVYRSFCFKPHTLIQLKKASRITTQNGSSVVPTTFEVISALVWISRTKALGIHPHETTKLLTIVDGRPKFNPPLPSGYFENGIAWSCAECSTGELTRNRFSFAVRTVHEALTTVTDSYIRSAIDYVELNRVLVDC